MIYFAHIQTCVWFWAHYVPDGIPSHIDNLYLFVGDSYQQHRFIIGGNSKYNYHVIRFLILPTQTTGTSLSSPPFPDFFITSNSRPTTLFLLVTWRYDQLLGVLGILFCLLYEYLQVDREIFKYFPENSTKKGINKGSGLYKTTGKGGEKKIVNHSTKRVSYHLSF